MGTVTRADLTITVDGKHLNEMQRDSILRLIQFARGAHTMDLHIRIGGRDEMIQMDWLKHAAIKYKAARSADPSSDQRQQNGEE